MKKKEKNPNHLSLGHLAIWKSSEVSAAWLNLIVLSYLSIYASDTLGLDVALLGLLLMGSKLLDAFTDIFAGWLVDNTHTKLGKGRPYEICIVGQTICTLLMFSGSTHWSTTIKCIWVVCMYTLTYSIFGTLRNAAQNVYTIRHFKNNRELVSKQAAFGGVFVMIFSIAVSVVFPIAMGQLATSAEGWRILVLIFMVPATLIGVLRFVFCKEESIETSSGTEEKVKLKDIWTLFRSNKYMWIFALIMLAYNIITNLAVSSYYYTYIVGNIGLAGVMSAVSIFILPIMMVFPALIKKIGTLGKMIFFLCWISVAGWALCFFAKDWIPGLFLGQIMGSLGTMPVMYFGSVFIMDICTYNEMNGLPRMESCSNILSNFTSKVGSAMGSWITGMMLAIGGYISSVDSEAVVQPDSALMMIRLDFAIIPLVLSLLIGLGCLAFSKLEVKAHKYEEEHAAIQES